MLSTILPILAIAAATAQAQQINSTTSLSGSYVPTYVECPSGQTFVRPASSGLSSREEAWLKTRKTVVTDALQTYLANANISGFDVQGYISTLKGEASLVPTIAMTLSGGGQRAEFCGLALVQALDARYPPALKAKTGGLLQAISYQSGLSGGSLATMVLGVNGYPTIAALQKNGNFNLTINDAAFEELGGKAELGFPVTISDAFGGTQGYHLGQSLTDPSIDPLSLTWSGIRARENFYNGSMPTPIIMIEEVLPPGVPGAVTYDTPNGTVYFPAVNSLTLFEATPFEFGSWTGRMQAFTPMEYYGTNYSNAAPVNASECVNGFDSAAYIAGTSLSAVNLWLAEYYSNGTVGQFAKRQSLDDGGKLPYPENEAVIEQMRVADGTAPFIEGELPEILDAFGNLTIEEGLYGLVANPFYGINNDYITEGAGDQDYLFLVDGSEGGQVNPIWPVIQPERGVDFIIVSDNSGTELSSGWMNGTTFKITSDTAIKAGIPFPKVPSVNTMLNKNYTSQPTFFGCNEAADVPLVLYIADAPYTSYSNISLVLDSITDGQLELIWQNGFTSITQNRNQLRENWSDCLACGVIHKSIMKMGLMLPEVCQNCMRDYCWQGDEDESQPAFLAPYPRLNQTLSWAEWNATVWSKA